MLPDCSREHLLKKISLGSMPPNPLAISRLRRSIGKFQFLLTKHNPMPVLFISDVVIYLHMCYNFSISYI